MHQKLELNIIGHYYIVVSKSIGSSMELIDLALGNLDPNQHICPGFTLLQRKGKYTIKLLLIIRRKKTEFKFLTIIILKYKFFKKEKVLNYNLSAVVEQTNIPTWTKSVQELHQSTGSFWEDKATKNLILKI